IYASLHPAAASDPIACTGTIASDGRVGPIEGVEKKQNAARAAGARTFLVPRENYAAVAHAAGMRVVPVASLTEALAAIGS
ncbi:MAG: signaling protein, partial [Candidatus Eremiobacteraeota bacterium]|nr:signaling protein [Candidatus Eremiobacteraeota bacterium]